MLARDARMVRRKREFGHDDGERLPVWGREKGRLLAATFLRFLAHLSRLKLWPSSRGETPAQGQAQAFSFAEVQGLAGALFPSRRRSCCPGPSSVAAGSRRGKGSTYRALMEGAGNERHAVQARAMLTFRRRHDAHRAVVGVDSTRLEPDARRLHLRTLVTAQKIVGSKMHSAQRAMAVDQTQAVLLT